MYATEQPDQGGTLLSTIATIEIRAGLFLASLPLLRIVLKKFGIDIELNGISALVPMLIGWSGMLLAVAGGSMRRYPAHPYLSHLPLIMWLGVFVLAFT